ncbi:hypothetical protein ACH5RR_036535 [Cinchona calisaya]|uniref:Uncharacterized protein n=1 Tax=Cinchona calisaya TaxID=153742 RepID=A0ABD2Y7B8_9GENT
MIDIQKALILHHVRIAATIRYFNLEDRFFNKNLDLLDDYSRVAFYNFATMEWIRARINFLRNKVLKEENMAEEEDNPNTNPFHCCRVVKCNMRIIIYQV